MERKEVLKAATKYISFFVGSDPLDWIHAGQHAARIAREHETGQITFTDALIALGVEIAAEGQAFAEAA